MAEAHVAINLPPVQPGWHSLTVDTHIHTFQAAASDHGLLVFVPHPRYLLTNSVRWVHSLKNKLVTALYPVHPFLAVILSVVTSIFVIAASPDSWLRSGFLAEWLWAIDESFSFVTQHLPLNYRLVYLSTIASLLVLLVIVFFQRLFLRVLLHYKGWMHDPPGKPSTLTKAWAASLTYLYIKRGKLLTYSFQHALPRLSVPNLTQTCERFLMSVKPLLSEEEFADLCKDKDNFLTSHGPRLQKYLVWKSWLTNNYLSDWWIRFVYLRGRSSIFINSNYYAIPTNFWHGLPPVYAPRQVTRAANIIHNWVKLKKMIDKETLPPLVAGAQPLCMEQYSRLFSTTRIPHREEDEVVHFESADSRHVIIYYKDTYYRLNVYKKNGRILTPYEFQVLLEHIKSDHQQRKRIPTSAEAHIAALTTLDRSKWAQIREDYFSTGVNHYSLSQIEKAMFILVLDDEKPDNPTALANSLFCGNGGNRWCDKSFNHIVYANGVSGMHVEHAWADAPIISHTCEITSVMEITNKNWDEKEHTILPPKDAPVDGGDFSVAQKLRFHMTHDLEEHILGALSEAQAASADLDLRVTNSKYGKRYPKKIGFSPDSFIQIALQLGYYRCHKSFALTYESAMMRLFRDGRTETIRSLSVESCEFVKGMDDPSVSEEKKKELHKIAVEKHNSYAKLASKGEAIDRHLFALYVVAMGTETDSPFLDHALKKIPWKLSTSQIPNRMYNGWPKDDNRGNNKAYGGIGGGFGPVADDGYGVCYLISGDSHLTFHISSKRKCPTTDTKKLGESIEGALRDICLLYGQE
uniref:Choline/carnitine acyltransferase domain-containing protein n=1 Tax=Paramoeba aestuarina TaxID=180227 RepID=A0A7S4L7K7_9EUKA|mmetsp:Transcript_32330/g.50563  ORF Transcript_32330/g.50563 Transcript_32330/m.50563 type:complete len:804 (+) Transcript_32330:42-2453(+)